MSAPAQSAGGASAPSTTTKATSPDALAPPPLSPLSPTSPLVASPLPHGYEPVPAGSSLRVQAREVDPYEPQEEFDLPWPGRILLALVDIVLVPLRILGAVLLLLLLWCLCKLFTLGARPAHHAGDPPFGPWRTWLVRASVRMVARPFCWCFGLVVSHRRHPSALTSRGVLVCNHIGYVEILALVAEYAPSVVAKAEIAQYPLIGAVAQAMQCVFVDRKNPDDRERVRLMLLERARAEPGKFPPLLLFPEGTTGNGASLLRFQKGIFAAGQPVQPLAFRTHFCYYNSGWPNGNMGLHVLGLLTRLYHAVSLTELPLYTPSPAERSDAILYADNVAMTLANHLRQPLSSKTMFDNPELVATIKHRQHKAALLAQANEAAATARAAEGGQATTAGTEGADQVHVIGVEAPQQGGEVHIDIAASPEPLQQQQQQPQRLKRLASRQQSAKVSPEPQQENATAPAPAPSLSHYPSHPSSGRRMGWAASTAGQPQQQQQQDAMPLPDGDEEDLSRQQAALARQQQQEQHSARGIAEPLQAS